MTEDNNPLANYLVAIVVAAIFVIALFISIIWNLLK
jgi:hypothetical protein